MRDAGRPLRALSRASRAVLWPPLAGVVVAACLVSGAAAGEAPPSPGRVWDDASAEELRAVMQELGYRAELRKAADERPWIRATTAGSSFNVELYDCGSNGNRCASVSIATGLTMKDKPRPDAINEWNAKRRWARAYLDEDGDPILRMDASIEGVTPGHLRRIFATWNLMLALFKKHIDLPHDNRHDDVRVSMVYPGPGR
jgi:hypothetical protein